MGRRVVSERERAEGVRERAVAEIRRRGVVEEVVREDTEDVAAEDRVESERSGDEGEEA